MAGKPCSWLGTICANCSLGFCWRSAGSDCLHEAKRSRSFPLPLLPFGSNFKDAEIPRNGRTVQNFLGYAVRQLLDAVSFPRGTRPLGKASPCLSPALSPEFHTVLSPAQKSDQANEDRREIRFLRVDYFGLSPLISSSQLQPSEYFSRAMISTEGFCLPHSMRWSELRSRSAFSASFSCVSPAAFRKRETFLPNATTVLLRPSTRKVTQISENPRAADMRLSFPWRFIGVLIRQPNNE